jgi:hypothetical protein
MAMSVTTRSLFLAAALTSMVTPSIASTRVAVYAIVDDIAFEPSSFEPERVWISGVFATPTPISSGLHEAPRRGHLYFSLNTADPRATRREWEALQASAGTGRAVGFGQYWMPCSRSAASGFPASDTANCSFEVELHSDRTLAAPDPYPTPSSEGVVTVFDHDDDICPRFGLPSVQIIAAMQKVHSPGSTPTKPPICAATAGLLPSSYLGWAFDDQTRDDGWAGATESLILQRFADAPGLKLADLRVECRETICRIHLAFPSSEYQDSKGNELAAKALDKLPGFADGGQIIPSRWGPTLDYYLQRSNQN